VRLHHQHVHALRSFAITNIGNLQAPITVHDSEGKTVHTTFEKALLNSVKPGTASQRLFYSIEPTNRTDTDGRYLLVMHKDTIEAATAYIDQVLLSLAHHHPGDMARIMRDDKPVTRANRVATSTRFQTYAQKLNNMIPTSITTTQPPPTAWKRRNSPTMDLTTDQFPPLDPTKKPRTENSTNHATTSATKSTESLTMIDLDEIEQAQQKIKMDLQMEIAQLRQATDTMQKTLQAEFNSAMQQLEIRVTTSTTQMIQNLGDSLQQAVTTMHSQAERSEKMLSQFHTAMEKNSQQLLQAVSAQIERLVQSPTSPERARKHLKEVTPHRLPDSFPTTQTDMTMTETSADGSHNPTARQASIPTDGNNPLAGRTK
jgi:hypothetical protein